MPDFLEGDPPPPPPMENPEVHVNTLNSIISIRIPLTQFFWLLPPKNSALPPSPRKIAMTIVLKPRSPSQ